MLSKPIPYREKNQQKTDDADDVGQEGVHQGRCHLGDAEPEVLSANATEVDAAIDATLPAGAAVFESPDDEPRVLEALDAAAGGGGAGGVQGTQGSLVNSRR